MRVLTCLLLLLFFGYAPAQTLTLNDSTVVNSAPLATGINIGTLSYFGSGQQYKNLLGSVNPYFEAPLFRQIWALQSNGTTTTFQNTNGFDTVSANYWAGATYIDYESSGTVRCSGTISGNTGYLSITSAVRTSDVVTLTVSSSPIGYISAGSTINVENVSDNSFNGYQAFTVTSVTSTTIVYSQTAANSTSSGGIVGMNVAPTYTVSPACPTAFAATDEPTITLAMTSTPESWWETGAGGVFGPQLSGGATLTSDTTDLCATCGAQALAMTAPGTATAQYTLSFDTEADDIFVLMNGTYTLSFWAKSAAGSPVITVNASRSSSGGFSCGPYTPALTAAWTQFTYTCTAAETQSTTSIGTVNVTVHATGGTSYIDNSVLQKNGSGTNTTVFRDEVVAAYQAFSPGMLRDWTAQNGETIDNWTRPDYQRQPSAAGAEYQVTPAGSAYNQLSLYDYLQLCQFLGTTPYLEVPITMSNQEASDLIDFLAGPNTTPYGLRRQNLGQATPWTSVFSTINLTPCNECWNGVFTGQNLQGPGQPNSEIYYYLSNRLRDIFASMRANTSFASNIKLGMPLQTANNGSADTAISRAKPDYVEIENYTYGSVSSFSTDALLWNAAYVEPWLMNTTTNDGSNFYTSTVDYNALNTCGASGTAHCLINIYEWGEGTQSGTIDQTHMDYINAGGGYGVEAAFQAPLHQQMFPGQFTYQGNFAFPQFSTGASNGTTNKLWGDIVDVGGATNLMRPQFLAMSLVNQSVIGPMYSCTYDSSNLSSWAGNTSNGTSVPPGVPAASNVPTLYAFCYKNGTNRAIVLVNTDIANSHTVTFAGTNLPTGTVAQRLYEPPTVDSLNETSTATGPTNHATATVVLTSSTLSSPSAITLAPSSVVSLSYSIATPPAVPASISGGVRASGASAIQ